MDDNRIYALRRLKGTLSLSQIADLRLVIETAEVQGNYFQGDDGGSVWEDDVAFTLRSLSQEFEVINDQ